MHKFSLLLLAVISVSVVDGAEAWKRDSGLKAVNGDFTASFTFRWNGFLPVKKPGEWVNGMVACHRSGYYEGWRLLLHHENEGKPVFEIGRKEGSVGLESGEGLSTGVWHRVAVSWEHSAANPNVGTMRLFTDGVLTAQSPADRPRPMVDASPIMLGYVDFGVGALDYEVADCAIVPKVLSEKEVAAQYRADPKVAADDPLASRTMMKKVVDRSFAALKLADERVRTLSKGLPAAIGKGMRENRRVAKTDELWLRDGETRVIEDIEFHGEELRIDRKDFSPVREKSVRNRFPAAVRDRVICARADGLDPFVPFGVGVTDRRAFLVYADGMRPLPRAAWPEKECANAEMKDGELRFAVSDAPVLPSGSKALVYGYWKYFWADAALPVEVLDDGVMRPLQGHQYGYCDKPRLSVMGVPEVMDKPGEWCVLDGMLYLLPPEKDFKFVTIPKFKGPFLRIRGKHGRIVLRNVIFTGSLACALDVSDCEDVLLENVAFRNNCGDDARIARCGKVRVNRSTFKNTGLTQLWLDTGDRVKLKKGDFLIRDCGFSRSGMLQRTYTPGILINGCGAIVSKCRFFDSPSSAIRIEGNDHAVLDCKFVRNVLESDDQGAIDIWGDPTYRGMVFARNVFRDVGGNGNHDCGRNAIRFDDFISGMAVISNTFVNASQGNFGAVNIHGGHYNLITGNEFRDCSRGIGGFGWGDKRMAERLAEDEIRGKTKLLENNSAYPEAYPDITRIGKDDFAQIIYGNIFENCCERIRGQCINSLMFDNK